MKLDVTVKQIRVLLQLAELNQDEDALSPAACRRGEEALQRGLPRVLLERYQSLVGAGRTPAVVAIERGACAGCHMRLPTMLEQIARRSLALHTCSHCRRMLYAPQLVREESPADERKRSRPAAPAPTAKRS